jgi:hypothetical protein
MYCSSRRHTTSCNAALIHTRLARVRFRSCHFSRCYLYLVTSLRQLDAANMSRSQSSVFFHVSLFVYCLCLVSTTTVLTLYIAHTCYVITTHIFLTLYVCMHADVLAYSPPLRHMCSNLIDTLMIYMRRVRRLVPLFTPFNRTRILVHNASIVHPHSYAQ